MSLPLKYFTTLFWKIVLPRSSLVGMKWGFPQNPIFVDGFQKITKLHCESVHLRTPFDTLRLIEFSYSFKNSGQPFTRSFI